MDIWINTTKLETVEEYKYLGATIDSLFCFKPHTSKLIRTVSHKLLLLAKIKNFGGELVAIDDVITSINRAQSYFLFGGVLEDTGNKNFVYRMYISEEMQALVNGTTFEPAIYITLPSALDPERVQLMNEKGINSAKLYLTYTKIK